MTNEKPGPLQVLIVDDEAPARARLRQLLDDTNQDHQQLAVCCCGEAADGLQALAQVDRLQPDLLLLDIRMPAMDGLEVARHLQQLDKPPAVIFTTAYDEFALQAFDANAVHYLVKPIRQQHLAEALSRVKTNQPPAPLPSDITANSPRSHFNINQNGNRYLVPVTDLLFLQAEQKYVTLHTADKEWLVDESLVHIEQEFGQQFIRVHRNALARVQAISGIGKNSDGFSLLFQPTDKQLPVSRRRIAALRKALK
ncbi:MAG: response regulator transcription factor [Immundisolibacteraceae bacterium]|nr:response regulator transcription factor [Immundisolibacteraceae bacterium]